MLNHANKRKANALGQDKRSGGGKGTGLRLQDNRPGMLLQRKQAEGLATGRNMGAALQRKETEPGTKNKTGQFNHSPQPVQRMHAGPGIIQLMGDEALNFNLYKQNADALDELSRITGVFLTGPRDTKPKSTGIWKEDLKKLFHKIGLDYTNVSVDALPGILREKILAAKEGASKQDAELLMRKKAMEEMHLKRQLEKHALVEKEKVETTAKDINRDENPHDLQVPQKMMLIAHKAELPAGLKTLGVGPCVAVGIETANFILLAHLDSDTKKGDVPAVVHQMLAALGKGPYEAHVLGGNSEESYHNLFLPLIMSLTGNGVKITSRRSTYAHGGSPVNVRLQANAQAETYKVKQELQPVDLVLERLHTIHGQEQNEMRAIDSMLKAIDITIANLDKIISSKKPLTEPEHFEFQQYIKVCRWLINILRSRDFDSKKQSALYFTMTGQLDEIRMGVAAVIARMQI